MEVMQWDRARHLAEAFAFSFLVIAYIWLRPLWWSWSLLIPLSLVGLSFFWHSETFESLGLSLRDGLGAVIAWRWWLASCAAALIALVCIEATTSIHVIYHWCGYACWCVVQQLLLQNMTYRRLRDGLGASWKTSGIAGAMFAAAHMPNPILVPATFLWGTVSTRLFEARPSVPVLWGDASAALGDALRHYAGRHEWPIPCGPGLLGRPASVTYFRAFLLTFFQKYK